MGEAGRASKQRHDSKASARLAPANLGAAVARGPGGPAPAPPQDASGWETIGRRPRSFIRQPEGGWSGIPGHGRARRACTPSRKSGHGSRPNVRIRGRCGPAAGPPAPAHRADRAGPRSPLLPRRGLRTGGPPAGTTAFRGVRLFHVRFPQTGAAEEAASRQGRAGTAACARRPDSSGRSSASPSEHGRFAPIAPRRATLRSACGRDGRTPGTHHRRTVHALAPIGSPLH